MVASIPPSRGNLLRLTFQYGNKELKCFPVRSQSYENDGKSERSNIVDDNLGVLRERISEVKFRERLCSRIKKGWDYQQFGYDPNLRKEAMVSESLELMGRVSGAIGFAFLGGSFFICFISLLFHVYKATN